MKLLYCKQCHDVFKLDYLMRCCKCALTAGAYEDDGLYAWYKGEDAVPLGFANDSLIENIGLQPASGWGRLFEAFVIAKSCPTFVNLTDEEEQSDE